MKIIEMFGLPYSGKSTMINIVKKVIKELKQQIIETRFMTIYLKAKRFLQLIIYF